MADVDFDDHFVEQEPLRDNRYENYTSEDEEELEDAKENATSVSKKAPPPVYTLDPDMEAHLLSVCQAVGGYEVKEMYQTTSAESGAKSSTKMMEKYVLGDEALECLRDIKRFLRHDDRTEGKCIMRMLGKWKFLLTDLVPIVSDHSNNIRIMEAAIEILVPLTWPVDIEETVYLEITRYMQSYKAVMTSAKFQQSVLNFFLRLLAKPYRERLERDTDNIRLILSLFRNLLCIPDPQVGGDVPTNAISLSNLQEKFLKSMKKNRLLDLFISFASSIDDADNRDWNLMILEIFYFIFHWYSPSDLLKPVQVEKEKITLRNSKPFQTISTSRHPRFGGSILVQTGCHSQRILTSAKPLSRQIETMYDDTKKAFKNVDKKTKSNRDLIDAYKSIQDEDVRLTLKETADTFIQSCFNVLMNSVKKDLVAERSKVRDEDYHRYLHMIAFFLRFQQAKNGCFNENIEKNLELVATALDRQSMVFALKQIDKYYTDKKPIPLHLSIKSFKQMLSLVSIMWESQVEDFKDVASNLLGNLFYERGYIDMLKLIVRNPIVMTKSLLEDIVELVHILLKQLERFINDRHGIMFARKKMKRRGANNDRSDEEDDNHYAYSESQLEFRQVELGFANENVINTYLNLLTQYQNLRPETVLCITKMFHRIFVKCEVHALFYRIDLFTVFNDIMNARVSLQRQNPCFKELVGFIRFVMSRFIKKTKEYPMIFVEMFYPKSRKIDVNRIHNLNDSGDLGTGSIDEGKLVEIQLNPRLSTNEQIGVLVEVLKKDHTELLDWIMSVLECVCLEREQALDDPDWPTEFELKPNGENEVSALRNNGHLLALLPLLYFDKKIDQLLDENTQNAQSKVTWIIPPTVLSSDLRYLQEIMMEYISNGIQLDRPLNQLVKKKKTKKEKKQKSGSDSDSEGAPSQKMRPTRKEKVEDQTKYLSAQYVEDSSDDDEYSIRLYRLRKEKEISTEAEHSTSSTRMAKAPITKTSQNDQNINNPNQLSDYVSTESDENHSPSNSNSSVESEIETGGSEQFITQKRRKVIDSDLESD